MGITERQHHAAYSQRMITQNYLKKVTNPGKMEVTASINLFHNAVTI